MIRHGYLAEASNKTPLVGKKPRFLRSVYIGRRINRYAVPNTLCHSAPLLFAFLLVVAPIVATAADHANVSQGSAESAQPSVSNVTAAVPAHLVCAIAPLTIADVKDIIGDTKESNATKSKELLLLVRGSVTTGWASLPRQKDFNGILADVTSAVVSNENDPSKVSSELTAAFNTACPRLATDDVADIRAAAMEAAGVPSTKSAVQKSSSSTPTPPTAVAGSASDFGQGDRFKFINNTRGFTNQDDSTDDGYTAPKRSEFHISSFDATKTYAQGYFQQGKHFFNLYGLAGTKPAFASPQSPQATGKNNESSTVTPPLTLDCSKAGAQGSNQGETVKYVKEGCPYEISGNDLKSAAARTQGWQFGVLVAPYKFHLVDHSTSASASIGGYLGYNYGNPAFSLTPVASAGIGAVPVPASTTPSSPAVAGASTTHTSLTLASGLIFGLKKSGSFQVGLLAGVDWAGAGAHYKYEGKPWLSFSFGTSLTGPSVTK
jgi:hypothetical protein